MICLETRQKIKEALRWKNVSQVAAEFKLSRNIVHDVMQGRVPKCAFWEARRKKIAESAKTMPVKAVAAKFGVSQSRVYAVLKREAAK